MSHNIYLTEPATRGIVHLDGGNNAPLNKTIGVIKMAKSVTPKASAKAPKVAKETVAKDKIEAEYKVKAGSRVHTFISMVNKKKQSYEDIAQAMFPDLASDPIVQRKKVRLLLTSIRKKFTFESVKNDKGVTTHYKVA